jgi:hypothetical protein
MQWYGSGCKDTGLTGYSMSRGSRRSWWTRHTSRLGHSRRGYGSRSSPFRYIPDVYLSRHRNILVAQIFIKSLMERHGKHVVYGDGGSWYPEACRASGLEHRLHTDYEKSLMERRTSASNGIDDFDDYYP